MNLSEGYLDGLYEEKVKKEKNLFYNFVNLEIKWIMELLNVYIYKHFNNTKMWNVRPATTK